MNSSDQCGLGRERDLIVEYFFEMRVLCVLSMAYVLCRGQQQRALDVPRSHSKKTVEKLTAVQAEAETVGVEAGKHSAS
ncbi:hypothetical protein BBAD15_g11843 [Beauveria bassiana D1-5]|uniref:Uncharacterized protein n=1 Tax=Beauveria bassiana D1-5 TaxID=1245745 RepID=A0A0A2V542_BEABA|nr:hypothetical protein CRV24_006358 [Beauveria bassiana]KAH8715482.1 hypothetical protein HC256_004301 [Beauveria bassiana]KGQ02936.1 hypothetical protein BBAD15_g11843 [Beauveria bassiana D1-5]